MSGIVPAFENAGGAMSTITVILLIVVVVAVAVAAWAFIQREKTLKLRNKYGTEYDRLADQEKSARRAETILETREKRVAKFNIRPLRQDEIERFAADWRVVQEHFVDDPRSAVSQADRLINDALKTRGYPMSEFEQQAADLSVEYPQVVDNYRKAHTIAQQDLRGSSSTEDLRKAMQYYRSLFEYVLGQHINQMEEVRNG
jgi:FtsZ-interacting cell division protein ZipA